MSVRILSPVKGEETELALALEKVVGEQRRSSKRLLSSRAGNKMGLPTFRCDGFLSHRKSPRILSAPTTNLASSPERAVVLSKRLERSLSRPRSRQGTASSRSRPIFLYDMFTSGPEDTSAMNGGKHHGQHANKSPTPSPHNPPITLLSRA